MPYVMRQMCDHKRITGVIYVRYVVTLFQIRWDYDDPPTTSLPARRGSQCGLPIAAREEFTVQPLTAEAPRRMPRSGLRVDLSGLTGNLEENQWAG